MQAIIVSVGDELTLGQTVDTNAVWLSARLAESGVLTRARLTLPDSRAAIARALRQAAGKADWVVVTGGLGPTRDDLTREGLAAALGVGLEFRPDALARIGAYFRLHGRPMPASNRRQARAPRGSRLLDNPCGTAPGLEARLGRAVILVFPGVPAEMQAMAERYLLPRLARRARRAIMTRTLHTIGLGESRVGEALGPLMRRTRNPTVGTTVAHGIVSVRLRSAAATRRAAAAALNRTVAAVRRRLGPAVFGSGDQTLAGAVGARLRARRETVATAESCTAGLLAAMLTETPGSSAWFRGGWVVYADAMKTALLGVPARLIARRGAVSEPVARRMARAARRRAGADYALALTGIAGPGGQTPDKPVGTVWIALAGARAAPGGVRCERFRFSGDRAMVRQRAALAALDMLRMDLRARAAPATATERSAR